VTRLARSAVILVLAVLAPIVAGCGSNAAQTTAPGATTAAATGPPHGVSVTQITLVDRSRPTAAGAQTPALPERTIETTVFFPDTDAAVEGSFPLIVFAHGLTGTPSRHTDLAETWARAGFVVALPAFPLTNTTVPGSPANYLDVNNQPADVSFVLDELLAADGDPLSPLHQRIDADRIGVSGHSLGAATTYAVTFDACCRDDRIDAAVVMAGVLVVQRDRMDYTIPTPALLFHGDADQVLSRQFDVEIYGRLSPPKWFVTLLGAGHSPPYEDAESPWDDVVETTSTDFWLGQLTGDAEALARLEADATVPGVSSIESDPG
jgi:dienelactone hydrolase